MALTTHEPNWHDRLWQWHSFALIFFLHVLVAVTPFVFTWVNEELFEFNKMMVVYALTTVLVTLWINKMILAERWLLKRTYLDIPLALFVLSQIIATLLSIHIPTSLFGYYTRFHGGLLSTLCYVALYYVIVNNVRWKQALPLLITLMGSAGLAALYAIPEHFGHSPSCYLITAGMAGGPQFDVACWIQDVKSRVFGTFGQPNWLAAYAIMIIPIGIVMTQLWRWPHKLPPATAKVVAGVSGLVTLLLFMVLLFTQSRSGFYGLLVGLAVFSGLSLGLWLRLEQRNLRLSSLKDGWPIALLVAGCIGLAGVFGTPASPAISRYLSRQTAPPVTTDQQSPSAPVANRLEEGGTDSGEIRKIVWTGAIDIWRRYPLFGSGVETFAYSYYLDRPMAHNLVSEWDFLYNKAHNEFLNYLATTGIFGLATMLILLGWFSLATLAIVFDLKRPLTPWQRWLVVGLLSGIAALSVSNFFGFSTVMVTVLMYLYFALPAVLTATTSAPLEKRQPASTLKPAALGGIGFSAFVCCYFLFQTYLSWQADFYFSRGKATILSGQIDQGLGLLQQAILTNPQESLYYDELAQTSGEIAVYLARQNQATASAQFVALAKQTSDQALSMNPHQLNYYRTRANMFMLLAEIDRAYLNDAYTTLNAAWKLAPTDAKIVYNLGLVEIDRGQTATGQQLLEQAIAMKPNYEAAHFKLGTLLEGQREWQAAEAHYQTILTKINPNNQAVINQLRQLEASKSAQPR